jgi:REP element-mobilizing transposase RayT
MRGLKSPPAGRQAPGVHLRGRKGVDGRTRCGYAYAEGGVMRRNKLEVYIHFIWTTWDREPWIVSGIERRIWRAIESEIRQLGCEVLAIGGMADHVHLLVKMSATCSIAELLKQTKGNSSHFVNDVLKPSVHFKWQPNYGAYSVSASEVEIIKDYITHQKAHHANGTLQAYLEESSE